MFTIDTASDLFSHERLRNYLNACDGQIFEALELYKWNSYLASSYWLLIQAVEVFTRNRIIKIHFADGVVNQSKLETITTGKFSIAQDVMECSRMTFGFWVYLMSTENSNTIWNSGVHKEFKPKTSRKILHGNLKIIQGLRNRIGHHEAIWHLNHEELNSKIFQVLASISDDAVAWVESTTNIQAVLAERPTWLTRS